MQVIRGGTTRAHASVVGDGVGRVRTGAAGPTVGDVEGVEASRAHAVLLAEGAVLDSASVAGTVVLGGTRRADAVGAALSVGGLTLTVIARHHEGRRTVAAGTIGDLVGWAHALTIGDHIVVDAGVADIVLLAELAVAHGAAKASVRVLGGTRGTCARSVDDLVGGVADAGAARAQHEGGVAGDAHVVGTAGQAVGQVAQVAHAVVLHIVGQAHAAAA